MKRLALAVVMAIGAGCEPCEPATELVTTGKAPAHTDVVLSVAAERCGPILGTLDWIPDGDQRLPNDMVGYCSWDDRRCGMHARVAADPEKYPEQDATMSALAHEIGHWCLQSEDEARVEAWASEVNAEADRLLHSE